MMEVVPVEWQHQDAVAVCMPCDGDIPLTLYCRYSGRTFRLRDLSRGRFVDGKRHQCYVSTLVCVLLEMYLRGVVELKKKEQLQVSIAIISLYTSRGQRISHAWVASYIAPLKVIIIIAPKSPLGYLCAVKLSNVGRSESVTFTLLRRSENCGCSDCVSSASR